jgi:hypothetical protein
MRRTIIALVVISAIGLASPVDAMQRPEISGTTCPKLGAQRKWKKAQFVCLSLGKRRVWMQTVAPTTTTTTITTSTTIPSGSFDKPILKGSSASNQQIQVTVLGSVWNVMNVVCEGNMFNDGCDSDYFSSTYQNGDPRSPIHWVRVDLELKNLGTQLIDVGREYSWGVVLSGRVYGVDEYPTGVDSIDAVQFLPGATVRTSAYAPVPKSLGTSNLMFIFRPSGNSTWTYFGT